jgi:hypothetical protein
MFRELLPHVFPNFVGEVPEGRWGPFGPDMIMLLQEWKSEAWHKPQYSSIPPVDAWSAATSAVMTKL